MAQSQAQRSQTANKDTAMKILTARIVTQLEMQQKEKIDDLKSGNDIAWGNQIRSYVFHPKNGKRSSHQRRNLQYSKRLWMVTSIALSSIIYATSRSKSSTNRKELLS